MGAGASRQSEPEVHVVVVESKTDGSIAAKLVRASTQNENGTSSPENASVLQSDYNPRETSKRSKRIGSLQSQLSRSSYQQNPPSSSYSQEHFRTGSIKTSPSPATENNAEFKIFRTHSNQEYTVYITEDGSMYYVDWEDQKWRVFPIEWCENGLFESEGLQNNVQREGELIHPFRGKLTTLLRQESINIMYYFDEKFKGWLPIPLTWEKHTPFVSRLVSEIKTACPQWKDEKSIVAGLRQCNYSVEDTISFYLSINDEGIFDKVKDNTNGHSDAIKQLQEQIENLKEQLNECTEEKKALKTSVLHLQDELNESKAENARLRKELDVIRAEQNKQSAIFEQSLNKTSFRQPQLTLKLGIIKPLVQSTRQEARALKFKLQSTHQQLQKSIRVNNEQMATLSQAMRLLASRYNQQANEIQEARALYRKEAMQRKLLFNEIQELKGNIRVFCRCRYDDTEACTLKFQEEKVFCVTNQGRKKEYEFEKVYGPDTTQEKVFEDTKPIITSCADGYNVCIIAYGQTGAGKTYTMMGPKHNPGVNIRSIEELFRVMEEKEKTNFKMKVSMVEIYNECIYDLLISPNEVHEKLQIQKKGKSIHVPGLTEIEVDSLESVIKIMTVGEKNRTTASTKMNTNSSRSHLLLTLTLKSYNSVSQTTTTGQLTLVDLAGSERISRSEATGSRLIEAAAINKSLSALGQVFGSIRDGALHIPFRNSKLTHLLQPCLGGDAKACMFVNVSPLVSNVPETISTLEFGMNARQVALGKATTHITKMN